MLVFYICNWHMLLFSGLFTHSNNFLPYFSVVFFSTAAIVLIGGCFEIILTCKQCEMIA